MLESTMQTGRHGLGVKLLNSTVESTIASRLTYMDFSDETKQRFNNVAKAVLTMGHGRRSSV